jgi:hypothetical protein
MGLILITSDITDVFFKPGYQASMCLAYINIANFTLQSLDATFIIFVFLYASCTIVFDGIINTKHHFYPGIFKNVGQYFDFTPKLHEVSPF